MPWPQHYLLVGKDKSRPTYDQLTTVQWVSGCIKAAMDLQESDKNFALQYLSNLLDDASDFSFDSAKACHAVVLTNMEQDRLSWSDTLELDRLRRQHAQRHIAPTFTQSTASSKSDSKAENRDIICKFFNDKKCSRHETHFTKGNWYLHICSNCRGNHAAKKCPGLTKN